MPTIATFQDSGIQYWFVEGHDLGPDHRAPTCAFVQAIMQDAKPPYAPAWLLFLPFDHRYSEDARWCTSLDEALQGLVEFT